MLSISRSCLIGALCVTAMAAQKKQTAADYMATAGKVGSEEKWAHAAMEYIYEKNHVNDARKRQQDVTQERSMANAYDRYSAVSEKLYEHRLTRLIHRMSEALAVMQQLGLQQCVEEAVMLNTEQPPGMYRRPSLTPPIAGYEPGFGLDVPQLRSHQAEYPAVHRPTDNLQYSSSGSGGGAHFPFVETHAIEDMTAKALTQLEEAHGTIREVAPLTGVEGEGWEAYVALHRKALARQKLILDLYNDVELKERYDADEAFREEELQRRGLAALVVAEPIGRDMQWHFAQGPAYQPFRSH